MPTPGNEPAAIARSDRGGEIQNVTPSSYGEPLAAVKCSACGGQGTRLRRTGFGPEDPIVSETCEHCGGSGGDLLGDGVSTVPGPDLNEREAMFDAGRPVRR